MFKSQHIMNNTFKQLKSYSGLDTELAVGTFPLPDQILMALEEICASETKVDERLKLSKSMKHCLLNRAARVMMQREFGKWLPKGSDKIIKDAFDGLVGIDDKIASVMWAIERLKGLEQWKKEQSVIRRAQSHAGRTNTRKVDGKWKDAQVYELPRLVKSEGESMQHEPARYIFRCDGYNVDLGKQDGNWSPVLRNSPDAAMQSVAKRLGKDIRGGAHTIIQNLVGKSNIIPAYITIWFQDQWVVIVSYQKDPKLTPSKFWLSEEGKLTMTNIPEQLPLTISELDYHILKDQSDLEIHDEEEIVIDYENPEEASYNLGVERDKETDAIDTSKFAEDDPENQLLNYLRGKLDRSESFITVGDLERAEVKELLYGEYIEVKGKMRWMHGLNGAKHDAKTFMNLYQSYGDPRSLDAYNSAMDRIAFFRDIIKAHHNIVAGSSQVSSAIRYWMREDCPYINYPKAVIKKLEIAHIAPDNDIETRPTLTADSKPEGRVGSVRRLKRGTTGIYMENGKIMTKAVPKLPEPPTNARNASPALKRRLSMLISQEYEERDMSRGEKAAREFHRALDLAIA